MKAVAALVLLTPLACLVSVLHAADDKAVDAELARLKGTWKVVSYEDDGYKLNEDTLKELPSLTFDGRKFTWSDGGKGSIEAIDLTKKPKTIDYKSPYKGKVQKLLAIYELDGDTFRDCTAAPGKERPKEFTGKEGTGCTLATYKRVK
jgi:uncharacterized protein (TIGR03067 family)